MSVLASKWAKRQRVRPTCRLVLTALADFADKQGRCWPAQSKLASETGLAIRTVRLVLAELSAAGVIVRCHRGNGTGGRTTDLITLAMATDFDLTAAPAAPHETPEFPASDAGKGEGGYRQIKDGLAAYDGRVSGSSCRGRNLSGTTKNYRPSRDETSQDLSQTDGLAAGTRDPFGDDAFGQPITHGEGLDDWIGRDAAMVVAR